MTMTVTVTAYASIASAPGSIAEVAAIWILARLVNSLVIAGIAQPSSWTVAGAVSDSISVPRKFPAACPVATQAKGRPGHATIQGRNGYSRRLQCAIIVFNISCLSAFAEEH